MSVVAWERKGPVVHKYCKNEGGSDPGLLESGEIGGKLLSIRKGFRTTLRDWITGFFRAAFLPKGYPDSVSKDYIMYQIWDTLQGIVSSVQRVLTTRSILQGVGVGDSLATPTAAVVMWVVKDGIGMVARVLFGAFQGANMDSNSKRWRLWADILNDIGLCIHLISPLFPFFFLPILCLGSVVMAIVGVAAFATRAALINHQAISDNMADVAAKDASQETAVLLIGMLSGLAVAPLLSSLSSALFLFLFLTVFHLYCNYKAVSSITFNTLNRERGKMLISEFLSLKMEEERRGSLDIPSFTTKLTPPTIIAQREHIFWSHSNPLDLGVRIHSLEKGLDVAHLEDLFKEFQGEKYILNRRKDDGIATVIFHTSATPEDVLKSFFHSELVYAGHFRSLKEMNDIFVSFQNSLKASGWKTEGHSLAPGEWRSHWELKKT